MKFNGDLNGLSLEAVVKSHSDRQPASYETEEKQRELMNILISRFNQELENGNCQDGLMRAKIQGGFFHKPEPGYKEIEALRKSGDFDSFAREYCMYVGEIQPLEDNWNIPSIEIIWDYKTYLKLISMAMLRDVKASGIEEIAKPLEAVRTMSVEHQANVIESFKGIVEKEQEAWHKELLDRICAKEGHHFEEWKLFARRELDGETLIPVWERKCAICGYKERRLEEPKDFASQREEHHRQILKSVKEQLENFKKGE